MAVADVDGLDIAYEVIGEDGQPWAITPGGRFSKDYGGVREMAEALAARGKQVLIWDRPNCGASSVCFTGSSESAVQADALAGLLHQLGMTPAVIIGGSGGARVSLLTVARHPDVAAGLAMWWISGGPYGLMSLGVHYCGNSIAAAWRDGMEAVVALPEWQEVLERNPANREHMLQLDRKEFIANLEHWMLAYYPSDTQLIPGLPDDDARAITAPTLVFRSGESDVHHTRETSERLAQLLPTARLVEPPWGDREWVERVDGSGDGGSLFARWPLLVPYLVEWADTNLGT
jgi:pimeloyl-ACP methyl ester carboxylesterase